MSLGRTEEAYRRYGLYAHRAGTYLATFRAVAKVYPSVPRAQIFSDLIATTPGEEGKWFATAKELGLYDIALKLVRSRPVIRRPSHAQPAILPSENLLLHKARDLRRSTGSPCGHGYEITSIDVWGAYHSTLKAAEHLGSISDTKARIRQLVAQEAGGGFVRQILGRELALA